MGSCAGVLVVEYAGCGAGGVGLYGDAGEGEWDGGGGVIGAGGEWRGFVCAL